MAYEALRSQVNKMHRASSYYGNVGGSIENKHIVGIRSIPQSSVVPVNRGNAINVIPEPLTLRPRFEKINSVASSVNSSPQPFSPSEYVFRFPSNAFTKNQQRESKQKSSISFAGRVLGGPGLSVKDLPENTFKKVHLDEEDRGIKKTKSASESILMQQRREAIALEKKTRPLIEEEKTRNEQRRREELRAIAAQKKTESEKRKTSSQKTIPVKNNEESMVLQLKNLEENDNKPRDTYFDPPTVFEAPHQEEHIEIPKITENSESKPKNKIEQKQNSTTSIVNTPSNKPEVQSYGPQPQVGKNAFNIARQAEERAKENEFKVRVPLAISENEHSIQKPSKISQQPKLPQNFGLKRLEKQRAKKAEQNRKKEETRKEFLRMNQERKIQALNSQFEEVQRRQAESDKVTLDLRNQLAAANKAREEDKAAFTKTTSELQTQLVSSREEAQRRQIEIQKLNSDLQNKKQKIIDISQGYEKQIADITKLAANNKILYYINKIANSKNINVLPRDDLNFHSTENPFQNEFTSTEKAFYGNNRSMSPVFIASLDKENERREQIRKQIRINKLKMDMTTELGKLEGQDLTNFDWKKFFDNLISKELEEETKKYQQNMTKLEQEKRSATNPIVRKVVSNGKFDQKYFEELANTNIDLSNMKNHNILNKYIEIYKKYHGFIFNNLKEQVNKYKYMNDINHRKKAILNQYLPLEDVEEIYGK